MDFGRFGTAVAASDLDDDVLGPGLRVLDHDVEVPVVVEDAGVQQFILGRLFVSLPVGIDEELVRVLGS